MKIEEIKNMRNKLPTKIQGVYLLFDKNLKLLYIGKAQSIRARINSHISPTSKNICHYRRIKYYGFIELKDERTRDFIESSLIFAFNPKYNYDKNGKTPPLKTEKQREEEYKKSRDYIIQEDFNNEIREIISGL